MELDIKKNKLDSNPKSSEEIDAMLPPADYSHYQIGTPFISASEGVKKDSSVFDFKKLQGFGLLERFNGAEFNKYSTTNKFSKDSGSLAVTVGAKSSFSIGMCKLDAQASTSLAFANVKETNTECVFMLYKFDGAWIKLDKGEANVNQIIASFKDEVAKAYWKIIFAPNEVEKYKAWEAFTKAYGTGCIYQLDLIAMSVAQVDCTLTKEGTSTKGEHALTVGVASKLGGFQASLDSMVQHTKDFAKSDYVINYYQRTYPVGNPTKPWIDELVKSALKKMEAKDWNSATAPDVKLIPPQFPEYPKIDPKKSEEATADNLSKSFEDLTKKEQDYKGLEMYNLAREEELYAIKSGVPKKYDRAKTHIQESLTHISDSDIAGLNGIEINKDDIRLNDFSIPFLYAKTLVEQKIGDVVFSAGEYKSFKEKYKNLLKDEFDTEEKINRYITTLAEKEKQNVYMYANIVYSYAALIELSEEQKKLAKSLYTKTKKVSSKFLSEDSSIDPPVTEEQYLDALLMTQMLDDCLICKDLDDYRAQLKVIKQNFYTKKIISDILNIELS